MKIEESLICSKCNGLDLELKREATYLYTYKLDSTHVPLPFLFHNRELINSNEHIECKKCGTRYSCNLDNLSTQIDFTILQKAIRSDLVKNPEFFG